jgi:hypothetical protein
VASGAKLQQMARSAFSLDRPDFDRLAIVSSGGMHPPLSFTL